jgi:hemerythrin superfamily protein
MTTITKATMAAKKTAPAKDAIALLKADHEAVAQLFAEFEKTRSAPNKKALVAKICSALRVHAQVEEEIFYPAVKAALKDKVLVPEAIVEQASLKALIGQLEGVEADSEVFDAKVKVLGEYVKHHVKEEHTEMFPKAKASTLDMAALGARMVARKAELMASMG